MAAESIQTNNLPWQLRHLGKNVSEWVQLQLSRRSPEPEDPLPTVTLPDWIGEVLFWAAIAGIVAWLTWVIAQQIDRALAHRPGKSKRRPTERPLYVPPEQSATDWVKQAQQFEQQGNWKAACRAFYLAALQLLHDRGWIPHQPSRTDGEYLQEIQHLKQPRPLQVLLRTHERSHFGNVPLTSENLHHCRRAYEEMAKR